MPHYIDEVKTERLTFNTFEEALHYAEVTGNTNPITSTKEITISSYHTDYVVAEGDGLGEHRDAIEAGQFYGAYIEIEEGANYEVIYALEPSNYSLTIRIKGVKC